MEYHVAYFVLIIWDQAPMAFVRKSEHFIKDMINTEVRKNELKFEVMQLVLFNFKQIKQSAILRRLAHFIV